MLDPIEFGAADSIFRGQALAILEQVQRSGAELVGLVSEEVSALALCDKRIPQFVGGFQEGVVVAAIWFAASRA